MVSPYHISPLWFATSIVAIILMIVYPLVVAVFVKRKLHVGWKYFWFGGLIFLLFQIVTRVPLVTALQAVFASQLKSSPAFLYFWLTMLALTASLFEEVGRYVGYRWLMKNEEKTWSKAVMYGVGHGGLEAMVLVAGLSLLTLINVSVLSTVNLNILPAAQRSAVLQQLHAISTQPVWLPILGLWERLWTLPVHVALSVLVLQVFRRKNIAWLWLAVLAHFIVDFTAVLIPTVLGNAVWVTLLVELVVAIFGGIGLWIIWRLRDQPHTATVAEEPGIQPAS